MNNELRNGTELLLTLTLAADLLSEYNASKLLKKQINRTIKMIDDKTSVHYNKMYKNDPEFVTNAMQCKHRLISQISKYNEVDTMILSEFVDKFDKNIDIARDKGVVFFNKLL